MRRRRINYEDRIFHDPGGRSSLRAGRRIHPCPTCGEPNRLTEEDKRRGYQCDECADRAEGYGY
jgi:DNA-directed RNA polymerase subunit RPC12/RpoP